MPKNIIHEKERLYEEILHLKQTVNTLKEENLKLKTKIGGLERETSRFGKLMQAANSISAEFGQNPNPKVTEVTFSWAFFNS